MNTNSQDSLNTQSNASEFLFGPHATEINEYVPPFYVIFKINDTVLHNAILDSGASHNLMPKIVMDNLGLDTIPYKYLFSFDSRKVHFFGIIKDLVVHLTQIPAKSIVMDVVVEDIPLIFGMLLSDSWETIVGGTL